MTHPDLSTFSLRRLAAGILMFGLCAAPLAARAADQIDVNTASVEELDGVPGIDSELAAAIVRERESGGSFGSLDELRRAGLSESQLDKLRRHLFAGSGRKAAEGVTLQPARSTARSGSGGDSAASEVQRILERYKAEPSVREVQDAAARYAEVHPERIASWQTRSRLAALGPQVRGEYRTVSQYDVRNDTNGNAADESVTTTGNEVRPLVRAQWDLDRVIFNPDELRVADQVVDLVRLRESVLDQVTKIYFERRRLQVELELAPPSDVAGRIRKELRVQELVADLDGMTGGFFSTELQRRGL